MPFDMRALAGILGGQGQQPQPQRAPWAEIGTAPPAQRQGALSGMLDPQVAMPIAAALLGGRTLKDSLAGAAQAAGPSIAAMKKRQAANEWIKWRSGKGDISPETLQFIQSDPELAQKLAVSELSGPGAEGMTNTIKTYDPASGVTKIMGWNPKSRRYDIEAGMAPPASGMSIEYDAATGGFKVLQGEGVAAGAKLPLGRTASNDLQKDIAPLEMQKQQVEHIGDLYDPSFLTYEGKATTAKNRFLDKLGVSGPNDRKQLGAVTRFKQNVEQIFNAYRKDITGAAAALAELDRLKQSVINTDQSPAEFEAAMGEFAQGLQRGLDIKKQLLREGIPLGSTQFSKEFERRFLGGDGAEQPAGDAAPALGAVTGPAQAAAAQGGAVVPYTEYFK